MLAHHCTAFTPSPAAFAHHRRPMLAQTYTERAATTLSQILVLEITPAMANYLFIRLSVHRAVHD
jgi:hypothetical protein